MSKRVTTLFLWEGFRLLQEIHADVPLTYVYSDQESYEPLARIDGTDSPDIFWFHCQPNGTPERMTDNEGELRWEGQNSAWGKLLREMPHKATDYPQNLRMQGQYLDRETGLHYNLFRYYDPDSGRFTQQDPIGLAGGINLYQYAPNALGWVDPWGLMKCSTHDRIINDANKVASPGGHITPKQAQILKGNLPKVQRRSVFQNKSVRKEFIRDQKYLMSQWEINTGRAWPTGATPHHIIPLESGGANKWWNLMPTNGSLPNHSLPGIEGPHAAGGVLRTTIQQSRKALPPGTITDLRL
jgi:RHS repeat-associated protein